MPKLNQVLAYEGSVKTRAEKSFTKAYQLLQKNEPLTGITRVYEPKEDEEGEQLPQESTLVQVRAGDVVSEVGKELTELFDVAFQKEVANTAARANVVVNGTALLEDVPVTYLLFLEKKLVDIHTFVSKLPVLDPSFEWHYDDTKGVYSTDTVKTHRSKKVPRVLVKAEATDKHPAQVDVWHEDVIAGYWNTTKLSGALPADRVNQLRDRVETLQKAVKVAREEANSIDAPQQTVGDKVFGYLFA